LIAVGAYVSARHGQPLPNSYAGHLSVFHFSWGRIARIALSWGAAMSFAGLLVAIGSRGPAQHRATRWNDRNSGLRRILFGLLYGTAYSLIVATAVDHTIGLPSPLTLAGAAIIAMVMAAGLAAGLAASNEAFRLGTVAAIAIGVMAGAPFLFYNNSSVGYA